MVLDPNLLAEPSARSEALAATRPPLTDADVVRHDISGRLERSAAIADALDIAANTHGPDEAPTRVPPTQRDAGRYSLCGRGQDEVTHLIAGSNRYICGQCIAAMFEGRAAPLAAPPARAEHAKEAEQVCSFCGKRGAKVEEMASGSGAAICTECVALDTDIIGPDLCA